MKTGGVIPLARTKILGINKLQKTCLKVSSCNIDLFVDFVAVASLL